MNEKIVAEAASMRIDAGVFERELAGVLGRIAGEFRHPASGLAGAGRAAGVGCGGAVETKNCWILAEQAEHGSPDGFQLPGGITTGR